MIKPKYKIIIYEGIDCAGKTTLRRAYDKFSNFRQLVVDRMFISSIIYNRVYNRHIDLEDTIHRDMQSFIELFQPLFVIVHPPFNIIMERIKERGDWCNTNEEFLKDIHDKYTLLIEKYRNNNNFLILDNADKTQENVIRLMAKMRMLL